MPSRTPFTIRQIAEALQDLGYQGQPVVDDKLSHVKSAANGDNFYVVCYTPELNPVRDRKDVVGFICFQANWRELVDQAEGELDAMCNGFNATVPFTKLYRKALEDGPALVIEAEVFLHAGMTRQDLQKHMNRFLHHFNIARSSLERCRRISKREILDRHNQAHDCIHGDEKDLEKAAYLYRQNAFLGYAGSQNNFGDLLETGLGVPKDPLLAVHWYTRAAERGEPTAYLSLASILEKSAESQDALLVAALYALLAVEQLPDGLNKGMASRIGTNLREKMTEDLFRLAESLAREYQPMYDESIKLTDSPGPAFIEPPGQPLIN